MSPKKTSVVKIELDEEDLSKLYMEGLELSKLFEISSTKCPIEAYSIFKSKTEQPQDRKSGMGFVMLDLAQGIVYLDRAKATEGTFSNFVKATTVSGIAEFHEIIFKITRKLNQSPFFVEDIEEIALIIDQKEQVEQGLSPFSYESPKVDDLEGHNVGISVSPES